MKLALKIAACAALMTLAAGCGSGKSPDGLTADQRERLNQIATNVGEVVDTSPDSLVVNDEWGAAESGQAAPANGAATAPVANAAAGNGQ
jgi:hypothetical protein